MTELYNHEQLHIVIMPTLSICVHHINSFDDNDNIIKYGAKRVPTFYAGQQRFLVGYIIFGKHVVASFPASGVL